LSSFGNRCKKIINRKMGTVYSFGVLLSMILFTRLTSYTNWRPHHVELTHHHGETFGTLGGTGVVQVQIGLSCREFLSRYRISRRSGVNGYACDIWSPFPNLARSLFPLRRFSAEGSVSNIGSSRRRVSSRAPLDWYYSPAVAHIHAAPLGVPSTVAIFRYLPFADHIQHVQGASKNYMSTLTWSGPRGPRRRRGTHVSSCNRIINSLQFS
jgi:hypothetical protein